MGNQLDHALVAPSGMHLTMACAASLLLQLLAPLEEDSEEEAEGSAAHYHMLRWCTGDQLPVGAVFQYKGRAWTVDIDMVNGSKLMAYQTRRGASGRFEDPVGMSVIHAECNGTPDYWHAMMEESEEHSIAEIHVKDYKYGHRYVDAFENWQLLCYAIGVCLRLGVTDPTIIVALSIIQPRAYHPDGPVKEWRLTYAELMTVWAPRIRARVEEALLPDAQATVGAHCLDCKARHLCKPLQYGAMSVAQFAGTGYVQLPNDALGAEARILLDAQKILDARLSGLKTQIEAQMRRGVAVPYWAMEPGQSRLSWNPDVTVDEIDAMGKAANVMLLKPRAPVTPTQAKDAGIADEVIELYATRGAAGRVLKPETTTKARKVFGANRT